MEKILWLASPMDSTLASSRAKGKPNTWAQGSTLGLEASPSAQADGRTDGRQASSLQPPAKGRSDFAEGEAKGPWL